MLKGLKHLDKVQEVVFIMASCMELLMAICEEYRLTVPYSRFILWLFFAIYFLRVLRTRYTKSEYAVLFIIMTIGVLCYFYSGVNAVIKAGIYAFALKEVDVRKLVKCMAVSLMIMVWVMFIRSVLIKDTSLQYLIDKRSNRGFDGIRYTFGFLNPNRFMGTFFTIVMMFLSVGKADKKRVLIFAINICALDMFFYYFTDTRTVFYLLLFIELLYVLVVCVDNKIIQRAVVIIWGISFSAMLLVSFLAACKVENAILRVIDKFISGRIQQLGDTSFAKENALGYIENWHLFTSLENRAGYDLGYVHIFYYYGILTAGCLLILIAYAGNILIRKKEYANLVILCGLCIYMFMEIYFFSNYVTKNYLLIFCAAVLWKREVTLAPLS